MIKKNIIHEIANKEMNRLEFLKNSGLVVLSLVGFGAIIGAMDRVNLLKEASDSTKNGFGGGKYGV